MACVEHIPTPGGNHILTIDSSGWSIAHEGNPGTPRASGTIPADIYADLGDLWDVTTRAEARLDMGAGRLASVVVDQTITVDGQTAHNRLAIVDITSG